jgi:hypothetical protein
MSIETLKKLSQILEKEDVKIVSIESAHTMSEGFGDITSLAGDKIKAMDKTMIEIRVLMPTEKN